MPIHSKLIYETATLKFAHQTLMNMRMTTLRMVFAAALIAGIGGSYAMPRADYFQSAQATPGPKRPVLVELFTSEGCSSCPPADALLAKLGSLQPVPGVEAIIMEEHVDYWDDQGWRDPFASPVATNRQKEYAFHLGGEVYTPEMIVDGRAAFVGSEGTEARKEIEAAAGFPKAEMSLEWAGTMRGDSGSLRVHIGRLPESATNGKPEVFVAITENGLHSSVKRGENAGRALAHDGVVHTITRVGAANPRSETAFDGEVPISGPNTGWKHENLRAVVFVQDPKTRRVFAAGAISYTAAQ